jgi:hypothetical protein
MNNERDITNLSYGKHCNLVNLLDPIKHEELTILYLIHRDPDD